VSRPAKEQLLADRVIVPAGVKGILFDLDGVLIDSSTFERQLVEEMLGISIDDQLWNEAFPYPIEDFFSEIGRGLGLRFSAEERQALTDRLRESRLRAAIPMIPGSREIIEAAREIGLQTAVVSNNDREQITTILGNLGLDSAFDQVIGIDRGIWAKPEPDLYRQAAEQLGIRPSECLAIEDSRIGIEAAQGAGISVLALGLRDPRALARYWSFDPIEIELKPGRPTEKLISTGPEFLAHMIEHILWRCGLGGLIAWNNDDYRSLGQMLGVELGGLEHRGSAVGIIDESLARVRLSGNQPGARISSAYPWLLERRVEDLPSGRPLEDLLQGLGEGLGLEIEAEILATRDPHHAWEALFRALGTALAPAPRGEVRIPQVSSSRQTAESSCRVELGQEGLDLDLQGPETQGWSGLLKPWAALGLTASLDFKALSSSHVVAEDLGIAIGQALLQAAEKAILETGIEGAGWASTGNVSIAVSIEGRSTCSVLVLGASQEEIDAESFGQDIDGLKAEDLDDFLFGLSQGMNGSLIFCRYQLGSLADDWRELFELLPQAIGEIFAPRPERQGLIPGVKATLE
jgi:HAD superfamily hydrolase (TIGR01509 family)